jgi:hypothetical protein
MTGGRLTAEQGMSDEKTRRDFLLTVGRTAGLLGLGGLVASAASRSVRGVAGAQTRRLPCERCPALGTCSVADSLQARDARGVQARPAGAVGAQRLCAINGVPAPREG